jgi:hypothetical protein
VLGAQLDTQQYAAVYAPLAGLATNQDDWEPEATLNGELQHLYMLVLAVGAATYELMRTQLALRESSESAVFQCRHSASLHNMRHII